MKSDNRELELALRRLLTEALARAAELRAAGRVAPTDPLERAAVTYANVAARRRGPVAVYRGELSLTHPAHGGRCGAVVRLAGGGLSPNTQAPPDPELLAFLLLRDRLQGRLIPAADGIAARLQSHAARVWVARLCEPVWSLSAAQIDNLLDGHVAASDALPETR